MRSPREHATAARFDPDADRGRQLPAGVSGDPHAATGDSVRSSAASASAGVRARKPAGARGDADERATAECRGCPASRPCVGGASGRALRAANDCGGSGACACASGCSLADVGDAGKAVACCAGAEHLGHDGADREVGRRSARSGIFCGFVGSKRSGDSGAVVTDYARRCASTVDVVRARCGPCIEHHARQRDRGCAGDRSGNCARAPAGARDDGSIGTSERSNGAYAYPHGAIGAGCCDRDDECGDLASNRARSDERGSKRRDCADVRRGVAGRPHDCLRRCEFAVFRTRARSPADNAACIHADNGLRTDASRRGCA